MAQIGAGTMGVVPGRKMVILNPNCGLFSVLTLFSEAKSFKTLYLSVFYEFFKTNIIFDIYIGK